MNGFVIGRLTISRSRYHCKKTGGCSFMPPDSVRLPSDPRYGSSATWAPLGSIAFQVRTPSHVVSGYFEQNGNGEVTACKVIIAALDRRNPPGAPGGCRRVVGLRLNGQQLLHGRRTAVSRTCRCLPPVAHGKFGGLAAAIERARQNPLIPTSEFLRRTDALTIAAAVKKRTIISR
jgi:hypothetical protein